MNLKRNNSESRGDGVEIEHCAKIIRLQRDRNNLVAKRQNRQGKIKWKALKFWKNEGKMDRIWDVFDFKMKILFMGSIREDDYVHGFYSTRIHISCELFERPEIE